MRKMASGGMVLAALALAASAWPCAMPDNLLQNCGFDTDLSGWRLGFGSYTHEPLDGSSQPGSMTALAWLSPETAGVRFHQDVHGLLPDTQYGYGTKVRLLKGTGATCTVWATQYTDAACTVPAAVPPGPAPLLVPSATWSLVRSGFLTGAVAPACVVFTASCGSDRPQAFSLRFDDAFLGAGLVPVELQSFSVE